MNTVITDEVVWSSLLDPTPVEDLESWQREYDPAEAAALDRQLDAAFGPVEVRAER